MLSWISGLCMPHHESISQRCYQRFECKYNTKHSKIQNFGKKNFITAV